MALNNFLILGASSYDPTLLIMMGAGVCFVVIALIAVNFIVKNAGKKLASSKTTLLDSSKDEKPERYSDAFVAAVTAAIHAAAGLDASKTIKIHSIRRVLGVAGRSAQNPVKYPDETAAAVIAAIHAAVGLDASKTIKIKSIKKVS